MDDRVFFLRGDIDEDVADQLGRFARLNAGRPVLVDINSKGGFVQDSEQIHRALRNHGKAIAYVSGECLSAAVLVLAGCAVRAGSRTSRYMLHSAWRHDDPQGKSHGCRVASHKMAIQIGKALGMNADRVLVWIDSKGSDGGETRWDADQAFKAGLLHCRGVQAGPADMSAGSRLLFLGRYLSRVSSAARKQENRKYVSHILATLPRLNSGIPERFHRGKMGRLLAGLPTGMIIG